MAKPDSQRNRADGASREVAEHRHVERPLPATASVDAAREGRRLQVWAHPMVRVFVAAAVLATVLWFFDSVRFVFLLLLLAGAVASLFDPVVERLPWRRSISGSVVGAAILLILGGLIALAIWWVPNPAGLSSQWTEVRTVLNNQLQTWSQQMGLEEPITLERLSSMTLNWLNGSADGSILATLSARIVEIAVGLMLLLFGTFYFMALHPRKMLDGVLPAMKPRRARQLENAATELPLLLRWWLLGHVVSLITVGALAYAGWALVGLDFALPLGIAAGIATLVPTLGPTAVGIVAVIVGATQGASYAFSALGVFVVVEAIESNLLLPVVMRKAVHLPPIITLFSLVLWAGIFGPLGLLLAIPINLVIWVLFKHFVLEDPQTSGSSGQTAPQVAG